MLGEPELYQLQRMLRAKTTCLVVIKGRRRIGKSRLIAEFANDDKFYRFVGLADKNTTAQSQRTRSKVDDVGEVKA